MKEFDFNSTIEKTSWLIDKFIPAGHLCFVLAQAGVGKSLLLNAVAISMIHEIPFGNLSVTGGDVLIIDQDTPENTLKRRILSLSNAMTTERKHKLYVESMGGYTLSERTLLTCIKMYPTASLIIIDSFHSVCGKLNPNYTSDMSILAKMKADCMNGRTVIFTHHISQKEETTVDTLMTGEPGNLAMGSSVIIQQADSYYIVGASAVAGRTEKIYIRPVSKRVSIPVKPLILRLLEIPDGEKIEFDSFYEQGINDIERDILLLFRESGKDQSVKEVYESMGHRHGENAVRKGLANLDKLGMIVMSKGKSNLFKYKLV